MQIIEQIIRLVFTAFLPIGVLAFALTWWAFRQGMLEERDGFRRSIG